MHSIRGTPMDIATKEREINNIKTKIVSFILNFSRNWGLYLGCTSLTIGHVLHVLLVLINLKAPSVFSWNSRSQRFFSLLKVTVRGSLKILSSCWGETEHPYFSLHLCHQTRDTNKVLLVALSVHYFLSFYEIWTRLTLQLCPAFWAGTQLIYQITTSDPPSRIFSSRLWVRYIHLSHRSFFVFNVCYPCFST